LANYLIFTFIAANFQMSRKFLFSLFLIAAGYYLAFKLTYKALEKEKIYNTFFSSFMPTYENQNGSINLVHKPFAKISENGYLVMDASHYAYIRDHMYSVDPALEESKYSSGFFPLFPITWKFFSSLGIITLNFFLHFAAILLLASAFCKNKIQLAAVTILALPTLTVFFLPYTEGMFIFFVSLALWAHKNNKRNLYIIGLALASATRPVFLLFVCGAIAAEVYRYLRTGKTDFKEVLTLTGTVTIVTFLVSLFQFSYHRESLFKFMTVQKHWDTYFRIPQTINDWSREGYGMNVWALFFCLIFGGAVLISGLLKKERAENDFDQWYYFSWIFLIGTCVYVLFFQGGTLHSLYRYTLCSPFFYVIIFQHMNNMKSMRLSSTIALAACLFIACSLFFIFSGYVSGWGFSKIGFLLLILNLLFFILRDKINSRYLYPGYAVLIACGILWNCYLYNMIFSEAWIFL